MEMIPSFKEDHVSQIPAIELLVNLGYSYLTPEEALQARGGKTSNVILEDMLEKQLRLINKIQYKGSEYPFSNNNITVAVSALKNVPYDGLVPRTKRYMICFPLVRVSRKRLVGIQRVMTSSMLIGRISKRMYFMSGAIWECT